MKRKYEYVSKNGFKCKVSCMLTGGKKFFYQYILYLIDEFDGLLSPSFLKWSNIYVVINDQHLS